MAPQQILSRIRSLRKERGLSQTDMASSLHIALKTYQNIETGVTRIDIERLEQISQVLDTDLNHLLGQEDDLGNIARLINSEKELYNKIIHDKEAYIAQLEESIRFYREILRESRAF